MVTRRKLCIITIAVDVQLSDGHQEPDADILAEEVASGVYIRRRDHLENLYPFVEVRSVDVVTPSPHWIDKK